MTESIKATRASVQIASLTVDGFMLPDGSYRMSQTQVAEAIAEAKSAVLFPKWLTRWLSS